MAEEKSDKVVELLEEQNKLMKDQRTSNYALSAAIVVFAFVPIAEEWGFMENKIWVMAGLIVILLAAVYGPLVLRYAPDRH